MKKVFSVLMAASMALGLAACSGSNTTTAASTKSEINVCIASEPATIDPALNSSVDGATYLIHLFSGVAKYEQDKDGKLVIVPDAVKELVDGVKGSDGKVTYTYTLRDGMKWSDGSAVTAGDFVYAWKRAVDPATASDYGYMFSVIDGYDETAPNLNVSAPDDKTLKVVLSNEVAYWDQLLAFPTYFPVKKDTVANANWATDPSTYVCNGPYKLDSWTHNSELTLVKNDDYWDASKITMKTINFYLSDNADNMKNGYDRFAVDDAVERYAAQVDALQRKIELYQEQLVETTRELNTIKEQLAEMEKNEAVRKEASDRIARLSIREANEIIATAQANADEIIREALGTARLVLTDLTKLYKSAGSVKGQMNTQLEDLLKQLDSFKLPEMPDLRWLNEAENKLR